MKIENMRRFIWNYDELKTILMAELRSQSLAVHGETALKLQDSGCILEVWPPREEPEDSK